MPGFLLLIFALFAWWVPVSAAPSPLPGEGYTISVNNDLSVMEVKGCLAVLPDRLFAREDDAGRFLIQPPAGYSMVNGHLQRGQDKPVTCFQYTVNLGRIAAETQIPGVPYHDTVNAVTTPGNWLWLPAASNKPIHITFVLPHSMQVSAPWKLQQRVGDMTEYILPPEDNNHDSIVVIGNFPVSIIPVGNTRIRLAVLHGDPRPDLEMMRQWMQYGVASVIELYGQFPLADPQVLVFPVGHADEPVPWGQIKRGGESSVQLFIDQNRPLQDYIADWTLTHELTHMTHPYLPLDGRWLSEGIATYYQYVLRARIGTISAEDAWRELNAGFERGRQQTRKGEDLLVASRNMHDSHEYMRVYWSGAAFALLTDWQLRRNHRGSLDATLAGFRRCCLPAREEWGTEQFIRKLDAISGTHVFSDVYGQISESDHFPSLATVYDALGLKPADGKRLELSDSADDLAVRRAIMQPKSLQVLNRDSLPAAVLVKSLTPETHGICRHDPDI